MLKSFCRIFGLFILVAYISSCGGRNANQVAGSDSLMADSDTVGIDSILLEEDPLPVEAPIKKAADLNFNDFIYQFTSNKSFQLSRIVFPLVVNEYGKTTYISEKQWRFSRFYAKDPYYICISDKESVLDMGNSNSISNVTIEYFYMNEGHVKDFCFKKDSGQWKMNKILEYPVDQHFDCSFVDFFHQFSVDSVLQLKHVEQEIVGLIEEDNVKLEITITPEEWSDIYSEGLPKGVFTSIVFGQKFKDSSHRVVIMEESSGGFAFFLFFRKVGEEWFLYKLKNY